MKYVALLRGINVGGNNSVKMSVLKELFEEKGFSDVFTYINSGNVIFSSEEQNVKKLTEKIEELISKKFNYKARVVIVSQSHIENVAAGVPEDWKTSSDIRCYIAFLSSNLNAENAKSEIEIREGVDKLDAGEGVLYMTSLLKDLTKSKFNKLASKKIYKEMTIRNYNTAKKLLALMEK